MAGALLLFLAELLLVGPSPDVLPTAPMALLFVVVGAALAWYTAHGAAAVPAGDTTAGRTGAMRRRSERSAVPALCDPDAAGRPRPRAPGAAR
ncbi:DUF6412 domain-containing protein [Nocardiopsis flavescens]|uniref:Uncharacterized protein n=1 Tax=Nocardiopsis flavescens TaxID=758803 RepID=A0A1M6N3L9_9ACTN|nr:hypothetical protein SAMN05421803_11142 [Nocardiopsis flavescens]